MSPEMIPAIFLTVFVGGMLVLLDSLRKERRRHRRRLRNSARALAERQMWEDRERIGGRN